MNDNAEYERFIRQKSQLDGYYGFEPHDIPDSLFPFQAKLVKWAIMKGRGGIFADCGLGKTLMELAWSQNIRTRS
jgi:SNF2 family DNA or RNA helicase